MGVEMEGVRAKELGVEPEKSLQGRLAGSFEMHGITGLIPIQLLL